MDRGVAIADAIVAELNDSSRIWQPLFMATQDFLHIFKAEDVEGVQVTVTPLTLQIQKADRRPKNTEAYMAAVVLSRNVRSNPDSEEVDNDAIRNLGFMAQQIFDFYTDWHYLATSVDVLARGTWKVLDVQRPLLFDPVWLREHGIWQTEIQIVAMGII